MRICLQDQNVAFADTLPPCWFYEAAIGLYAAGDDNILADDVLHFAIGPADQLAGFQHLNFCDVLFYLEQLIRRFGALALPRHQAPADDRHKNNPEQGDGDADGRKVEHAKWLAHQICAKFGNVDIGWCPDHGHQTAQYGAKSQRH